MRTFFLLFSSRLSRHELEGKVECLKQLLQENGEVIQILYSLNIVEVHSTSFEILKTMPGVTQIYLCQ